MTKYASSRSVEGRQVDLAKANLQLYSLCYISVSSEFHNSKIHKQQLDLNTSFILFFFNILHHLPCAHLQIFRSPWIRVIGANFINIAIPRSSGSEPCHYRRYDGVRIQDAFLNETYHAQVYWCSEPFISTQVI